MKTKDMCIVSVMTALICIAAPLTVPIGAIPITLATFVIYLAGALLGMKRGFCAVALYIALGMVGLPVFAGFSGGLAKLTGVTGGYIVGYLPMVAIVGAAANRSRSRAWALPVAMVLGTIVLYAVGTAWFVMLTKNSLASALAVCVLPFLLGDTLKIVAATALAAALQKPFARLLS